MIEEAKTIRVKCPSCHQQIELPETEAGLWVTCPGCETGFTPSDHLPKQKAFRPPVENKPAPKLNQVSKSSEFERIKTRAEQLSTLSILAMGLGLACIIAAGFMAIADASGWPMVYAGCGIFGSGITLCFLAQLFHIRAALEKDSR